MTSPPSLTELTVAWQDLPVADVLDRLLTTLASRHPGFDELRTMLRAVTGGVDCEEIPEPEPGAPKSDWVAALVWCGRRLFDREERLDRARFQCFHVQLEAAIVAYRAALKIDCNCAEACLELAKAYRFQQRPHDALPLIDHALIVAPESAEAHLLKGRMLYRLGRLTGAVGAFSQALQLQPDFGEAAEDMRVVQGDLQAFNQVNKFYAALANRFHPDKNKPPLIFIHFGYNNYLLYSLCSARFLNPNRRIILIGDRSNLVFSTYGIEHFEIDSFRTGELLQEFNRRFLFFFNKATVWDKTWSRFIFERWFIIYEFVKRQSITSFWTFDSDTLITGNLDEVEPHLQDIDFTEQNSRMSIHGFINNISAVEGYLRHINQMFSDESRYSEYTPQAFSGGAFNEMAAYIDYKNKTPTLKTLWLGDILFPGTFIDHLWYDEDSSFIEHSNGHKSLKFQSDGYVRVFHTTRQELIKVYTLTFDFMVFQDIGHIFGYCLHQLERSTNKTNSTKI